METTTPEASALDEINLPTMATAMPAHRALDEIDLSFADFLKQTAEDFDALDAIWVACDLRGLAAREVGRGTFRDPDLGPLAVLTEDLPGAVEATFRKIRGVMTNNF